MGEPVLLSTRIVVPGPLKLEMGLLHSSGLDTVGAIVNRLETTSVAVERSVIDVSVARTMGVWVGGTVGVNVSVGGTEVEVGFATSVSATSVNAAVKAVP